LFFTAHFARTSSAAGFLSNYGAPIGSGQQAKTRGKATQSLHNKLPPVVVFHVTES